MPGQYYDSESGLFYNWNRYYSPALGRYISSDLIGLEGGLNTFNYAESSPVMFVDPEGLMVEVDPNCVNNGRGGDVIIPCTPMLGGGMGGPRGISGKSSANASSAAKGASQNCGTCSTPDYVVSPGGTVYPIPQGAAGPTPARSGSGGQYQGGSGGNGLNPRATGFRYMDPTTSGKNPYPSGRGVYNNETGQTINPITGRTIDPSDPMAHIPGGR